MNRRLFLQKCAAASALVPIALQGQKQGVRFGSREEAEDFPVNGIALPDEGWNLWIDDQASWETDEIHLPDTFKLAGLPVHPPTGGWQALERNLKSSNAAVVNLPTTVEQYFWKRFGSRPYTPDEYRYAADDPIPENGAYRGVSWWWRDVLIPADFAAKRITLRVRGARMRAEVFLNATLVGYSIMEELPFECDLTAAALPGKQNRLAIRITNPGGRYDWVDGGNIRWGQVNLYRSHGFGGLDRGLVLHSSPPTAQIADTWVLNTPAARTVHAFATVVGSMQEAPLFQVVEIATGEVLAHARGEVQTASSHDSRQTMRAELSLPEARLWDLATPNLYHLRTTLTALGGEKDVRTVCFGFRWFGPEGLGTNALFRLNGRRIKLYTSISWGFWGLNGLWPTPELAEREVRQAKKLGLNCLNFHRNVGKEDVLNAHDRLGLLRYMEPGGGKLSVGKMPAEASLNAAGIVMEKP